MQTKTKEITMDDAIAAKFRRHKLASIALQQEKALLGNIQRLHPTVYSMYFKSRIFHTRNRNIAQDIQNECSKRGAFGNILAQHSTNYSGFNCEIFRFLKDMEYPVESTR